MDVTERVVAELRVRGIDALREMVESKTIEQSFIDYKETQQPDYSGAKALAASDKKNFREAVSGFGNSEGGVIVWGVATKKNSGIPESLKPFKGPAQFHSLSEVLVSTSTVPLHNGVHSLVIEDPSHAGYGYVVTVVPKWEGLPIQVLEGRQFFMRAGDSFIAIPHGILAGLFGRRPQSYVIPKLVYSNSDPKLEGAWLNFSIGLTLVNAGKGIARDIYLNTTVRGSGKTLIIEGAITHPKFEAGHAFGFITNLMSDSDLRLAPEAVIQPSILGIRMCPPFDEEFHVEMSCGAEGQMPLKRVIRRGTNELKRLYDVAVSGALTGGPWFEEFLKAEA